MRNPICFALDVPTTSEADRLVNLLAPHVGAFKVGLELFVASHKDGWWPQSGVPVVLDLKLHDIPETVSRAVRAGGDLGATHMTLHVQQRRAIEAAVEAAAPYGIQLLGVTVLTSMEAEDLIRLGYRLPSDSVPHNMLENDHLRRDVGEVALARAKFGASCGLSGFVCSPQEVASLKAEVPEGFFLVPGVRPAGSATGDQKRVGTPSQAVRDGASLIVVGRPIRDALDPVTAAQEILAETQAQ